MRYRRRRTRTSSGTLLVTFFLGLGLGFTLCYALFQVTGREIPHGESPASIALEPPAQPRTVSLEREPAAIAQANTAALAAAPEPFPDGEAGPQALPSAPTWVAKNIVIALPEMPEEATFAMLAHFAPTGVVLPDEAFGAPGLVAPLCARLRDTISPPPVVMARLEPAVASLAGGVTLRELGEGTPEDAGAAAELWGRALRALGIDAVLGPRLDASQGGPVPVEATFSADASALIAHGTAVIAGLRAGGVASIAVGYPGEASAVHSAGLPVLGDAGDINALVDLMAPFAAAIQEDVPALLVAHVAVPAIETGPPPPPASFSRKLVYQLLRERRAYGGAILASDVTALPMALDVGPDVAAVAALAAGCDAVILGVNSPDVLARVCHAIAATLEEGLLTRAGLEEGAARVAALTDGLPPLLPLLPEEPVEAQDTHASAPDESAAAPGGTAPTTHAVARGETLGGIAGRYGVTVAEIRKWNGMAPDAVLKYGQTLRIHGAQSAAGADQSAPEEAPAPPPPPMETNGESLSPPPPGTRHDAVVFGEADTIEGIAQRHGVTAQEIRVWNGLSAGAPEVGEVIHLYLPAGEVTRELAPASTPEAPEGNYATHVITAGDTLHSIARAHGTTVQELVRINGLSDPNHVKLGQKLKVPARE